MYYKNPISRFVLRKNWLRRVRMRLGAYQRRLNKNAFDDLALIFADNQCDTIMDVGANVGFVTYQFQQRFPRATVYAFEPNPTVFSQLKKGYQDEALVKLFNVGVGDVTGSLTFNVNANTGTSSFLQPAPYHQAHLARKMLDPIEVDIVRIEDFAQENEISHINILKLDIEGYEQKAIEGAGSLLAEQRIDAIYSEVSLVPQYVGQPLFHELTGFLQDNGYHMYNLYDFTPQETVIHQASIGNAIYISERYRTVLEGKYGALNCGW